MNDFDFAEWDNQFDSELLKREVANAESNSGDFENVPYGTYEVKINKLELAKTKTGSPKMSCWFKILEGDQKDRLIFMNQVMTTGFGIHKCNELLKSLSSGLPVQFEGWQQYAKLLVDILGEIDGKYEYQLKYEGQVSKKDGKTYDTFKIEKVFEATPF